MFSNRFDVLMSKIIFLKIKKLHFNIFLNEKTTTTATKIPNIP